MTLINPATKKSRYTGYLREILRTWRTSKSYECLSSLFLNAYKSQNTRILTQLTTLLINKFISTLRSPNHKKLFHRTKKNFYKTLLKKFLTLKKTKSKFLAQLFS